MKRSAPAINLKHGFVAATVLWCIWTIVACGKKNEYVEPPPPKVTVAKPLQKAITDYLEFTGNTHAFEEVEIRARVAGFFAKQRVCSRYSG